MNRRTPRTPRFAPTLEGLERRLALSSSSLLISGALQPRASTTADDVEQTKPSPDLVRAALDKLGSDHGVMVGDTPWDVRAAARGGVQTIAVLTGGFAAEELREAGAVNVFESIDQLRERLEETPLA